MMKLPRRRRRAAVALAACASLAAAGAASAPSMAAAPAVNPQAAAFEQSFMSQTIDHHFLGVKMGRLCMDRARSGRLADLCTAIVVAQSMESSRMRDDFLLKWYGVEKHPALDAAGVATLKKLSRLRGRAFDIRMARTFISHHQMQTERSQACLSSAEHHELVHTCMDQIDAQSEEIKQFRRVLASYGLKR